MSRVYCPQVLIGADLKSIEPIINAWLSGDENMKNIFRKGKANPKDPEGDVYCVVGAAASKYSPDVYTPADILRLQKTPLRLRDRAKVIFLAPTYSQHWRTLAQSLDCSEDEAYLILKGFYGTFPKILEAEHDVMQKVFDGDPVVTHFGASRRFRLSRPYNYSRELRHRWLCELPAVLKMSGADGHIIREANNMRVQNVASQLQKLMLCMMVEDRVDYFDPELELHDAIYGTTPIHMILPAVQYINRIMTEDILDEMESLGIPLFSKDDNPLRTDIKVGFDRANMIGVAEFIKQNEHIMIKPWKEN